MKVYVEALDKTAYFPDGTPNSIVKKALGDLVNRKQFEARPEPTGEAPALTPTMSDELPEQAAPQPSDAIQQPDIQPEVPSDAIRQPDIASPEQARWEATATPERWRGDTTAGDTATLASHTKDYIVPAMQGAVNAVEQSGPVNAMLQPYARVGDQINKSAAYAVNKAVDLISPYLMTADEEKEMRGKHPNLMAAGYAAAATGIPGLGGYLFSPELRQEFVEKSKGEQQKEILGQTAGYEAMAAGGAAFKNVVGALAETFPILTKPFHELPGAVNTKFHEVAPGWLRKVAVKERGLVVKDILSETFKMEQAGLSEAEILRALKQEFGNAAAYERYKEKQGITTEQPTSTPVDTKASRATPQSDLPGAVEQVKETPKAEPVKPVPTEPEPVARKNAATSGFADPKDIKVSKPLSELPEIIELADDIMGKVPSVKAALPGGARGHFDPRSFMARITKEVAADPVQARATIVHEIGHAVAAMPRNVAKRRNMLGYLSGLNNFLKTTLPIRKGEPPLTAKRRAALRREAALIVKGEQAVDADIAKAMPITSEDIISIWNSIEPGKGVTPELMGYVKSISGAEKKSIIKEALKGSVPQELQRFATVTASKPKTLTELEFRQRVAKKYKDLIEKEIKDRYLAKREDVLEELKGVSAKWRPWDRDKSPENFRKYRDSNDELFADFISALVNHPELVKSDAPLSNELFNNYLDNMPEFRDAYNKLIGRRKMSKDELRAHRSERLREGFEVSKKRRNEKIKRDEQKDSLPQRLKTGLAVGLHNVNYPVESKLDLAIRKAKGTPKAKLASEMLDDQEALQNLDSMLSVPVNQFKDALTEALDSGVTQEDIGEFLFHGRITGKGQRYNLAGSKGFGEKKLSLEQKLWLRRTLGLKKFKALKKVKAEFRDIYENEIIPILEDGGLYPKELIDTFKREKDYVKFSVSKWLEDKGISRNSEMAKVYGQTGSYEDIENPVSATIFQILDMVKASKQNIIKQDLVTFFKPEQAKGRSPKQIKGHEIVPVVYDGKVKKFYIPEDFVAAYRTPGVSKAVAAVGDFFRLLHWPFKALVVKYNMAWQTGNVVMDAEGTFKNIAEIGPKDLPALKREYGKAFRAVKKYLKTGEMTPEIESMKKDGVLPADRMYNTFDETFEDALERLFKDYDEWFTTAQEAAKHKEDIDTFGKIMNAITTMAGKPARALDYTGMLQETVGKVAAYTWLEANTDLSPAEINVKVRNFASTSNFTKKGAWQILTNSMLPFSNIAEKGLTTGLKSLRNDPKEYIYKTLALNVGHRLLTKALTAGVGTAIAVAVHEHFDKDEEPKPVNKAVEVVKRKERIMRGASSYVKDHYQVYPIGLGKDGKSYLFTIPMDYNGQVASALTNAIVSGKMTGTDGVLGALLEANPYKLSGTLAAVVDLVKFYGQDEIPTKYKGRQIMSYQTQKIGGSAAAKEMAKHTWNTMGLRVIYQLPYTELDVNQNFWEKLLKYPIASGLSRYIKVTDAGLREELQKALDEDDIDMAKETRARKHRAIMLANGDVIKEEDFYGLVQDIYDDPKKVADEVLKNQIIAMGDVYFTALVRTNSKRKRAIIMKQFFKNNAIELNPEKNEANQQILRALEKKK